MSIKMLSQTVHVKNKNIGLKLAIFFSVAKQAFHQND